MTCEHPSEVGAISGHVSDDELALLGERFVSQDASMRIPAHVLRCVRCHATFLEFVRSAAGFRLGVGLDRPPEDLLAEARALAPTSETPRTKPHDQREGTNGEQRRPSWGRWVPATAVLLVAGALLWPSSEPNLSLDELERAASEQCALPGVEELHGRQSPPVTRSSSVVDEPRFQERQRELRHRYESDPSTETAVRLIGVSVHLRQLEVAEAFLDEARMHDEVAPQLLMLEGVVLLRRGDHEGAVNMLERARSGAPEDALIRYNLAIALYAAENPAGREELLWILEHAAESALAASARRILASK